MLAFRKNESEACVNVMRFLAAPHSWHKLQLVLFSFLICALTRGGAHRFVFITSRGASANKKFNSLLPIYQQCNFFVRHQQQIFFRLLQRKLLAKAMSFRIFL
jgi:hypothetical protein